MVRRLGGAKAEGCGGRGPRPVRRLGSMLLIEMVWEDTRAVSVVFGGHAIMLEHREVVGCTLGGSWNRTAIFAGWGSEVIFRDGGARIV